MKNYSNAKLGMKLVLSDKFISLFYRQTGSAIARRFL